MATKIVLKLTLTVDMDACPHDHTSTACERVNDLFRYGTIADAFGAVGLVLVDYDVRDDHQDLPPDQDVDTCCNVCMVSDHDTCANNPNCSCCCNTMENK